MAGFVSIDKVLYSRRVTDRNQKNGSGMLMRSDLWELEPATGNKQDKRSSAPKVGRARCELTVGRTHKQTGKAEVHGKGNLANHLFGWLVYDSYRRVWHFQLKRNKYPSAQAFGSKKSAAIAMGRCL